MAVYQITGRGLTAFTFYIEYILALWCGIHTHLWLQTEDYQDLKPNFKLAEILLEKPYDKANNDNQLFYTACPAVIRASKMEQIQRLPGC